MRTSFTAGTARALPPALLLACLTAGCYTFEHISGDPASLPQPARVPRVRLILTSGGSLTTRPAHLVHLPGACGVTYVREGTRTVLHEGTRTPFTGVVPDSLVLSTRTVSDPGGRAARRWYLQDSCLIQADTGMFVVVPEGHGPGLLIREGETADGDEFSGFLPDTFVSAVEHEQISPVRSVVFGAVIAATVAGMVVAMDRMRGQWVGR